MSDDINRAHRVLRALGKGAEPYAANVLPMVQTLQDPQQRAQVIASLELVREELYRTAWLGSKAYDPYDRVVDAIEELEAM